MPNETTIEHPARAGDAKPALAHIKLDADDPRDWAGPGARLWVNDDEGETVLEIALGGTPGREAIAQLQCAGYTIVEVVTPTLLIVEKH